MVEAGRHLQRQLAQAPAQADRRFLRSGRDEAWRVDLSFALHSSRSVRARRPIPSQRPATICGRASSEKQGNRRWSWSRFSGKPAGGAVVKAYPEVGDPIELKTDQEGRIDHPGVAEGRTGLLVKWVEKAAGTFEGKPYAEVRHYATLTVAPAAKPSSAAANAAPFALLPEAVNSFGGAVLGDWLYVYSGHAGDTHKYDNNTTSKHFRRLNLKDRQTWEELPCGPPLQGLTLVVGRRSALSDRRHVRSSGAWKARRSDLRWRILPGSIRSQKPGPTLPALPTPRSTHDAVVSGGKIYVVGGWAMHGGDSVNSEWLEDALVFDLSQKDGRWEKLEAPPFQRRALAVAAIKGKVYVLGGLEEDGNVVKSVEIYDPAKKAWTHGPELPGSKLQGFAPSAFGIGEKLYVSGADGLLHKLSEAGDRWEVAGKFAVPRLTHRLLPGIAGDLLAVGGNFAGSPVRFIESINVAGARAEGPKVVCWPVSLDTQARQGQAVGLFQSALIAAGGNRTTEPHAFSASNLVRDAVKISLGSLEAASLPALPEPRQSAEVVIAQSGRKSEVYLLGGIGPDGDVSRTMGDAFRFDAASSHWTKLEGVIPDRRGMFRAVIHDGAIWIFGGNIWDGDMSHPGSMPNEVLRWDLAGEKAGLRLHRQAASAPATVIRRGRAGQEVLPWSAGLALT